MSDCLGKVPVLRSLVKEGLYVDNLRKLQRLSGELVSASEYPVEFFVLETIFYDLRMAWDDRPVTEQEYNNVQNRLSGLIQDLLAALEERMENRLITEKLGILIREFISLRPDL
jgi:hypothetical protein